MLASLVIIPVGPSAAEVWATADLIKVVEEARVRRPQLRAWLLWNRMRRTRSATEIPDEARDELKVPALKSRLGHRVAYSEALGRGRTVTEWSDKTAREELQALVGELVRLLK
jgi:chromosome partitioning protein